MKKFAILAGLMTLALVIGVAGTSLRSGTAQARPDDVVSFGADVCLSTVINELVDNNDEDYANAAGFAGKCFGLYVPANLNAVAEVLDGADIAEATDGNLDGNVDDPDTWSILVDRSAAQLGEDGVPGANGQTMWVLAMVSNDDPVNIDADEGLLWSTNFPAVPPAGYDSETDCTDVAGSWFGGVEEDCDSDNATIGDGVVADLVFGDGVADLGDAQLAVEQAGVVVEIDYTVVGAPDEIAIAATKATIQEGADDEDCYLSEFTDKIALPQITGLMATVTDDDGTELTGIRVEWDTSDDDVATLALWQGDGANQFDLRTTTYTIAKSGAVVAPNLGCGQDTGDVTFSAALYVDDDIDDEVDVTVIGAPDSLEPAANPMTITCNGTNSSEVSVTVKDSAGNPVVAGNKVRFEVVALGTANPIVAKTDENGVAKSTITPLTGVTAGVTVLISVVDNTDVEANLLVACSPAVPVVVPVAPPVVKPPVTGDAGLLP